MAIDAPHPEENARGLRLLIALVVSFMAAMISSGYAYAEQKIYLDFDTIKEAYDADPGAPGLPPADEIYDYSPGQRTFILDYLNTRYVPYSMMFLEGPRPIGEAFSASEITLNKGFGAGGEGVDFRNLDNDDDAFANTISIFKFLGKDEITDPWTDADVTIATANLAGHEAEHLMGTRHHDALEPAGMGLGGGIFPGDFLPAYPGPSAAGDTGSTINSQHAGGSLSFPALTTPKFVSQRAAVRLLMAETFMGDDFLTDETSTTNHAVDMAQFVPTPGFVIPHPMRPPGPPGSPVPVLLTGFAATVTGELDPDGGGGFLPDYFKFSGMVGQHWTIEAMSALLGDRYADHADVAILLLTADTGAVIPYHSSLAMNDDDDDHGFFGASLIDVILPYTGDFVIEVVAAGPFLGTGKTGTDGGSYELFLYTTHTVTVIPEPASVALMMLPVTLLLLRFRGRRAAV